MCDNILTIYDDWMNSMMIDMLRLVTHRGDILGYIMILCFIGTNLISSTSNMESVEGTKKFNSKAPW